MTALVLALMMAAGAGSADQLCSFCHPDVRVEFKTSIHSSEEVTCVSCHGGNPRADSVEAAHRGDFRKNLSRRDIPALCNTCHGNTAMMRPYNLPTDQYALYQTSQHGKALARGDLQAAVCTDCHGVHGILAKDNPRSGVHPRNTPQTCGRCHADPAMMKKYGWTSDPLAGFLAGRHGEALNSRQNENAPECSRCHGAHGAAPPGVGDVNKVCGQCHSTARTYFLESPHREGMKAAGLPDCSSCHGHHEIATTELSMMDTVCQKCHEPGDEQVELGSQMKTVYIAASGDVDSADAIVQEAAAVPLYIEDYQARLEEARTALVEARTAMHSLDLDTVERLTNRARSIGHEVESEARKKLDGLKWRRVGLLVFWFYLLVTIATLVYYRRRALRAASPGGAD